MKITVTELFNNLDSHNYDKVTGYKVLIDDKIYHTNIRAKRFWYYSEYKKRVKGLNFSRTFTRRNRVKHNSDLWSLLRETVKNHKELAHG